MRPRLWSALVVALGLLVLTGALSLLFLHKVERDSLNDLEQSLNVLARTLALQVSTDRHLLQSVQNESGSRIRIFDQRGALTVDSLRTPSETEAVTLRARPEVQAAFRGEYGAATRFADETGQSMALYVAVPCEKGGVVYVSHDTDAIMRRLERLRQPIRIAMVSLGALAALLGLGVVLEVRSRLKRVSAGTSRMAAGHLDERLPAQGRGDVEDIARHFNQMAESLQAKIRELEAERDKTKRFTEDIAHELKTPLTGLTGSLHALQNGASDEERSRFLSNLQSDTDRLSHLVASLLEIQRLEHDAVRPSRFDMVSLADRVVEHYEAEAVRRGVSLEVHGEDVPVLADPDKIGRVLENLVENAIRHAPAGTVVRIEATQDGLSVQVAVSDEGPGLRPEDRDRIFERFYRHPHNGGSAGLGLSIARDLVVLHGGTIGVDSPNGHGARFYFTLVSPRN